MHKIFITAVALGSLNLVAMEQKNEKVEIKTTMGNFMLPYNDQTKIGALKSQLELWEGMPKDQQKLVTYKNEGLLHGFSITRSDSLDNELFVQNVVSTFDTTTFELTVLVKAQNNIQQK